MSVVCLSPLGRLLFSFLDHASPRHCPLLPPIFWCCHLVGNYRALFHCLHLTHSDSIVQPAIGYSSCRPCFFQLNSTLAYTLKRYDRLYCPVHVGFPKFSMGALFNALFLLSPSSLSIVAFPFWSFLPIPRYSYHSSHVYCWRDHISSGSVEFLLISAIPACHFCPGACLSLWVEQAI